MFLSALAGIASSINLFVRVRLYSFLKGMTSVIEDFEPLADMRVTLSSVLDMSTAELLHYRLTECQTRGCCETFVIHAHACLLYSCSCMPSLFLKGKKLFIYV